MSKVDIVENSQGDNRDMTEIKLDSVAEMDQKDEKIKIRTPKRIVHCSDGVYEEYSDEEDEDEHHVDWLELLTIDEPTNEQKMSYPWWATFKAARGLGHVLKYMDSWGEWLADEFGLLRPVYQDLIDQHAELMEDAGVPIDESEFNVISDPPQKSEL